MKRILGLDLGTKTLGMCISDPLKITTNPIENFVFENENYNIPLERIDTVIKEKKYEISHIVLGYPLRMTGTKSEFTLKVENFYEMLIKKFPDIKIVLEDERLTTKQSLKMMKDQNLKSKDIKKKIDMISSCVILKNYLDRL